MYRYYMVTPEICLEMRLMNSQLAMDFTLC